MKCVTERFSESGYGTSKMHESGAVFVYGCIGEKTKSYGLDEYVGEIFIVYIEKWGCRMNPDCGGPVYIFFH